MSRDEQRDATKGAQEASAPAGFPQSAQLSAAAESSVRGQGNAEQQHLQLAAQPCDSRGQKPSQACREFPAVWQSADATKQGERAFGDRGWTRCSCQSTPGPHSRRLQLLSSCQRLARGERIHHSYYTSKPDTFWGVSAPLSLQTVWAEGWEQVPGSAPARVPVTPCARVGKLPPMPSWNCEMYLKEKKNRAEVVTHPQPSPMNGTESIELLLQPQGWLQAQRSRGAPSEEWGTHVL